MWEQGRKARRWSVQSGSIKRECLERLILFGSGHLRRALQEFVAHYRIERPASTPGTRQQGAHRERLRVPHGRRGGRRRTTRRTAAQLPARGLTAVHLPELIAFPEVQTPVESLGLPTVLALLGGWRPAPASHAYGNGTLVAEADGPAPCGIRPVDPSFPPALCSLDERHRRPATLDG